MNRHFKDTKYYLRRAAATAKRGIVEEAEPLRERVSRLRGDEEEEDDRRIAQARTRATAGTRRAREEVERVVSRGRARARKVRGSSSE